jgi:hypothetical protein
VKERPSQYLVEKCKTLDKVLEFFMGPDKERRINFLAQIGFWEWEMDTLIYSVSSFEERSRAWAAASSTEDALRKQGILLRAGLVKSTRYDKQMREKYGVKVSAPVSQLNEVIGRWNELLDVCENTLMSKKLDEAVENFGANVLTSLEKFRKKILQTD